jgi:hypothetical protein|tara:strand:- start:558 stop:689 length:132 start_codon:yes stop_codon:yes gene_type:complete
MEVTSDPIIRFPLAGHHPQGIVEIRNMKNKNKVNKNEEKRKYE